MKIAVVLLLALYSLQVSGDCGVCGTCGQGYECRANRCLPERPDPADTCNPQNCDLSTHNCVYHRGGGGVYRCACNPKKCPGKCRHNRCEEPQPVTIHTCSPSCSPGDACLQRRGGEYQCECDRNACSALRGFCVAGRCHVRRRPDSGCSPECRSRGDTCIFGLCYTIAIDKCNYVDCLPGYLCKDGNCYRSEVLSANNNNNDDEEVDFFPRSGFQSIDDNFIDFDFFENKLKYARPATNNEIPF